MRRLLNAPLGSARQMTSLIVADQWRRAIHMLARLISPKGTMLLRRFAKRPSAHLQTTKRHVASTMVRAVVSRVLMGRFM
jgi:hypothetical protein